MTFIVIVGALVIGRALGFMIKMLTLPYVPTFTDEIIEGEETGVVRVEHTPRFPQSFEEMAQILGEEDDK